MMMNRLSYILFYSLLFGTICSLHTQGELVANFYAKEAQINSQLYKISAQELQEFLGISFDTIPTISAEELKERKDREPDLFIINVLPKALYDDCHIVGSDSVPLRNLVTCAAEWPRDKEIIVYCALDICDAGQKAYILLTCMGFTNVVDYEGGIKEWYQLGYDTNGPASASYLHETISKLHEWKDELECYCCIELAQ